MSCITKINLQIMISTDIKDAIHEAKKLYETYKVPVCFMFNGVEKIY